MSDLTRYTCGPYGRVPSDVGDFADYDEAQGKISLLEQQLQQAEARVAELELERDGFRNLSIRYKNDSEGKQSLLTASERRAAVATKALDSEATAHTKLRNSIHSGAWLLRKQAEAFEECYEDMLSLPEHLEFTAKEMAGFKCGLQHVKGEALSLRQQADELEND